MVKLIVTGVICYLLGAGTVIELILAAIRQKAKQDIQKWIKYRD